MIKNYKLFKESLLDKLHGPTEEELLDNLKNMEPNKMLLKSVEVGLLKGVEYALENFQYFGSVLSNALYEAFNKNHMDIAIFLLNNGAKIIGFHTVPVIEKVSDLNRDDILELILKNGIDEYFLSQFDNILQENAKKGHYKIISLLLKYNIGVSEKSIEETLFHAASIKDEKIVSLLLDYGADLFTLPVSLIKKLFIDGSPKLRKEIMKHKDVIKKINVQYRKDKYKEFSNESLLNKLEGPNEEEFWNDIKDLDFNIIREK